MGVIFITHDMGVVADIADRVLVMYRGEAVETGSVEEIFRSPQHPYTQSLLAAVPRLGEMRGQDLPRRFPLPGQPLAESETPDTVVAGEPILQVRDLVARFPVRGGLLNRVTREVHAVEKVSFDLWPGETLSLVGESGCGKSTTGPREAPLPSTVSGSIPSPAASCRLCGAIFSLFFRILTPRLIRVRRSAIRLWSRCGCMACCVGKQRVSGSPGC